MVLAKTMVNGFGGAKDYGEERLQPKDGRTVVVTICKFRDGKERMYGTKKTLHHLERMQRGKSRYTQFRFWIFGVILCFCCNYSRSEDEPTG